MSSGIDADTQAIWEEAWAEQDSSKQKTLTGSDLRAVFLALGKDIAYAEAKEMKMNLQQFTQHMASLTVRHSKPAEIRHAIHTLNHSANNSSTLKTTELRLFLASHGDRLTNDEAATLVSDADPRATGFVDVEQLCNIIASG